MLYEGLSPNYKAFAPTLSSFEIPQNIYVAIEKPKWRTEIREEIQALKKKSIWELAILPEEKCPVKCKWIFTIKHKSNGSMERCKARLVAKGSHKLMA